MSKAVYSEFLMEMQSTIIFQYRGQNFLRIISETKGIQTY